MLPSGEIELLKRIERRRLTSSKLRRVGWLNFKFSIAAWALFMILLPPPAVAQAIGAWHYTWAGSTFLGSMISMVGISLSFFYRFRRISVVIELVGLIFMLCGTFVYFAIQLAIIVTALTPESGADFSVVLEARGALTVFAWAMVCAVIARLLTVIPRFHKE